MAGLLDQLYAFASDGDSRGKVLGGLLDAINRGTVAQTAGAPVDLATLLTNAAIAGGGYLGHKTGILKRPPDLIDPATVPGSSEWLGQKMQNAGMVSPERNPAAETIAGGLLGPLAGAAMAQRAPQIAAMANKVAENAAAPRQLNPQAGAIVYHGSPHKFDKFDSSKIGTGEGAQAYGHGLYLAESPNVAKTYQDMSPTALTSPVRLFKGQELEPGTPQYHAATLLDGMGLQQARKTVAGWISGARPEMAREAEGWKKTLETLNAATSKADFKQVKNRGSLYKVDLPDSAIAKMLDWDKPLSQQAPEVQGAVSALMEKRAAEAEAQRIAMNAQYPGRTTHPVLSKIANKPRTAFDYKGEAAVSQLVQELGGPDKAAAFLRAQGIPGIRYLDGGSRGTGQGTSNFVVFPGEEGLLSILERNGQPLR